mmetsp:Transcript_14415/g.21637  ORF Transcript_14415/g.21637 Transcript_14415/m.21637 type:complete len:2162 (-) Transcript_14415:214-6699(-)|eukprot:CAMPEP_0185033488 /NCGR_PEP_ID=MMETSP1103-20130426/22459_1 /TAXON_ID=36769 /ORGANISM="Paraphysomonas bandaiensis, Strain Caron Lab Isolate" /LENGTH=2161 /DNA_ID=CAMNT_0027569769 /DNA_START=16 /DNA_END=6501 /DNA_ORIENTATION=+
MDSNPESSDGVDNRPLDVRLEDKNWKTRSGAYAELNNLLKSAMDDDPIFEEYARYMPKMASDSNASALDTGLDSVFLFADRAPVACIRQQADRICTGIIDKALGANKASSQQKGRSIVLKLMEVDDPTTCTGILLSRLSDKKPKIPGVCLSIIKEGVELFGVKPFPIRDVISSLGPVLDGNNSGARDGAMSLAVELTRWIGRAPLGSLVDGMRSAQKSDYEKLVAGNETEGKPSPSLWLRKDRPSATAAVTSSPGKGGTASGSGGTSSDGAPEEIDPREFVEEVDLPKKLKSTDFSTLVAEEKWSEQLKGMQLVIDAIGPTPKLKAKTDIHDILDLCKGFLRQGHVQLQVSSLRILALLADGLRGEFSHSIRPLTQTVIMKCKEKRLLPDVSFVLTNTLKYCLGFESLLDDICEHIRNKKTPPHGRICLMEFVQISLRDIPGRVGTECLKPLADAVVASCEDSDVKVRDSCGVTLGVLAAGVRARGRGAVDAHRTLMALEQSAPRVYKKMMAAMDGSSGNVPPSAPNSQLSAPARAKSEDTTSSSATDSSTARPGLRKPVAGIKKKPVGAASAAPKKTSAPPPAAVSSSNDDNVDELAMSGEEAAAALGDLGIPDWEGEVQPLMASDKWQDKVAALGKIEEFVKASEVGGQASAPLVAYIKGQFNNFKVTNVSVLKGILQLVSSAAQHSGNTSFSRSGAMEVIQAWGDKMADKKISDLICSVLTALSESVSPGFVVKQMKRVIDKTRAPLAHQNFLDWLKNAISEFGASLFPIQFVGAFCQSEMDNKTAAVRTSAVEVMGALYYQLGPRFLAIAMSDDMKPALKSVLETEFQKVGHDPAAATKSFRAVKGEAPAVASGGAIPRTDLSSALERSVVTDLTFSEGKNSWQNRKSAMEAIIQVCERSGHYIAGNATAKEVIKALKDRLNDTQANLKPLGASALGHLISSLEPEYSARVLRVIAGPLIGGVADNKKAMRDASVQSLQMIVSCCKGECATPDANLFGALVPALSEAVLNPVGRLELLTWVLAQVESPTAMKCEWTELAHSLVVALQDKIAAVRSVAEQLFSALVSKGYVSKAEASKSFRDLPPANARAVQPALDRILSAASTAPAVATDPPSPTRAGAPVRRHQQVEVESTSAPERPASKTSKLAAPKTSRSDVADAPVAPAVEPENVSKTFPLKKTNKEKRLEDFYKQNWPQPPEDPGEAEMQALKSTWEPLMAPELFAVIFQETKGLVNQDSVMGAMAELTSLLDEEAYGATSGMPFGPGVGEVVIQHTDLMLRWAALALCLRESSSGLMHILLLISKIFNKIDSVGGQLHEAEISTILPALIERSGHRSERHKKAFTSAIGGVKGTVSPSRLCQLLLQGLRCKNKKTRVNCVEMISNIIRESGPVVLGRQGILQIGSIFNTRETDVALRNAALDFCFYLYLHVGSNKTKLMKLLGDISEKAVPMIDHRIKEKLKGEPADVKPVVPAPSQQQRSQPEETTRAESIKRAVSPGPRRKPAAAAVEEDAPTLSLTPLDTEKAGGFSMGDDMDAPFRLEMTPPEGETGKNKPANRSERRYSGAAPIPAAASECDGENTWRVVDSLSPSTTSRRISLGAEGSSELDSVCTDIISKVDDMLKGQQSRSVNDYSSISQTAKEYLKIQHTILRDEWSTEKLSVADNEVLLKRMPSLIDRAVRCLRHGFSNPLVSNTASSVPSGSVLSHPLSKTMDPGLVIVSIAVICAVLDRKDMSRSISEESIRLVIEEAVRHLVDPRLSSVEAAGDEIDLARQLSSGLTAVVLKVVKSPYIKQGTVMCAIINNLMLCIEDKPHSRPLPSGCTRPLSRLLLKLLDAEAGRGADAAFRMPNVDCMRLVSVLNTFFNEHPASPPQDETPYCCAKTVLAEMIKALGILEVLRITKILKIPPTSFLRRLIDRIDVDSNCGRGLPESSVAPDLSAKIVAIVDRINHSRDKMAPIRDLHQLAKAHPEIVVAHYLRHLSSTFQNYVMDALAKLDDPHQQSASDTEGLVSELPAPPRKPVSAAVEPPSAPNSAAVPAEGGASEALRILEGLKSRPRNIRSGSTFHGAGNLDADNSDLVSVGSMSSRSSSVNRAIIQDKIKGTLSSLSASLSLDPTPGSPLAVASSGAVSNSEGDLAARLQRLKKMDSSRSRETFTHDNL